jgi:hypothetical protein
MPQDNNPSRAVSSEFKRLQQLEQNFISSALRIAGPVIFLAGLLCTIIAFVSLLSGIGSLGRTHYLWLGFIGLPLMFVGGMLCQFEFLGAVYRFIVGESVPVAADTVNYLAEETKGTVETVAKAAAKGVMEGIKEGHAESRQAKD